MTLTRSDLGSGFYGIERLSDENLRGTSNAAGDEFVDSPEVCHGVREVVVGERKGEDLDKLARRHLHIIQLGWRQRHLRP